MADRLQLRRDTAERWESVNPTLNLCEIGLVIDSTGLVYGMKIGDGSRVWNALPMMPVAEKVTASNIADKAVTSSKLADGAVTARAIASRSVGINAVSSELESYIKTGAARPNLILNSAFDALDTRYNTPHLINWGFNYYEESELIPNGDGTNSAYTEKITYGHPYKNILKNRTYNLTFRYKLVTPSASGAKPCIKVPAGFMMDGGTGVEFSSGTIWTLSDSTEEITVDVRCYSTKEPDDMTFGLIIMCENGRIMISNPKLELSDGSGATAYCRNEEDYADAYSFQPYLRSGVNIKTINGQHITGTGNIDINRIVTDILTEKGLI